MVGAFRGGQSALTRNLNLVARLIKQGFGTRIFYVAIDGFDTHANQAERHSALLQELSNAVGGFFQTLKEGDHDKKVVLLTFSEFGLRVKENGSRGTDHGAASCLFVAGPSVKGGPVGEHPKLDDLDSGDLRHAIDFRRVTPPCSTSGWAWIAGRCSNGQFPHLPLLKRRTNMNGFRTVSVVAFLLAGQARALSATPLADLTPERLLLASAQVYLRWDGVAAHREQYAQTALGQLLARDLAPLRKEIFDLYPKLLRSELTERKLLDGLPPGKLAGIHVAVAESSKLLDVVAEHGLVVGAEVNPLLNLWQMAVGAVQSARGRRLTATRSCRVSR